MHTRNYLFFFFAVVVAVWFMYSNSSQAQDSAPIQLKKDPPKASITLTDPQADPDDYLQLFRKDVRSEKKQIIAANMDLTDVEAEKFWPVYDKYATDLSKIYDTEIALLKDYADNYASMTGEQAESYVRKRAAIEQSMLDLRLSYIPAFRKVLSGRNTALFYQIDWRLGRAIDIQLAQMPLINQ